MSDENSVVLNEDKVVALASTERVLRTLKLVSSILTTVSKVTVGFELDNQIAEKFAWLLEQPWFNEFLDLALNYFKDKEPTKENLTAFLKLAKGKN